jgi:hypothetical protein
MSDGQIAINTNATSPGLFFKDAGGAIIKVGPVHVGTTAPNSSPAGSTGNSLGEQWLDTSGGGYVLKIWDGSAWRSEVGEFVDAAGDTMTGALILPSGTAAAPALGVGSTDNGVYSPGADQVALSTNGTGRLFVDASGNVGVGASTPNNYANYKTLTLNGLSGAEIDLEVNDILSGSFWASANGTRLQSGAGLPIIFNTGTNERLRITSGGLVGIGTSSIRGTSLLDARGDISFGSNANYYGLLSYNAVTGHIESTSSDGGFKWIRASGPTTSMTLDSSGRLGIGTTSPGANLVIEGQGDTSQILDARTNAANGAYARLQFWSKNGSGVNNFGEIEYDGDGNMNIGSYGSGASNVNLTFATSGTERARIDTSGRLLVGTSSSATAGDSASAKVQIQANTAASSGDAIISLQRGQSAASISSDSPLGKILFTDNAGNEYGVIQCRTDAASGVGDYPGRLVFSTTADGASSPTERMRIQSTGIITFGASTDSSPAVNGVTGIAVDSIANYLAVCRQSNTALAVGRITNDGELVAFHQDGTKEGSISVSGTTVSYNGAHLSRWSQLPNGAEREEILRGTILSNIDEMCEWGAEDNEQLNRMKVSDVEGDKNVSGVFQSWDDDDDTYTDDFYCAMTGDFIIRIGAGVTVERGDLLMSAGDGTAKPQDDDIIRSKTIAKVTSTNVSCTYDDGSYCVPCVLMAC